MAVGSFIPKKALPSSSVMPSQRLASFRNQQLGSLLQSGGAPAPAGGSIDAPAIAPSSVREQAAKTTALTPVAAKTVGIGGQVKEGNARLAAIQKAVQAKQAPKAPQVSMEGQYAGPGKQATGKVSKGQISVKDTVRVGNAYLRRDAGNAFIQMSAAFKQATGRSLGITEGWRSYDEQVRLYKLYRSGRGNLAAPPGTSTHGAGTAVDINGYGDPNGAAFQWLRQNSGRFGYKWTGGTFSQIEPWHWDYVG